MRRRRRKKKKHEEEEEEEEEEGGGGDKHVCTEIPRCDGCSDVDRTCGQGQRSAGPYMACLAFRPDVRRSACRALLFFSSHSQARGAHHVPSLLLVGKCSSSSHVPWRRAPLGGSVAGVAPGEDGTTLPATVAPVQSPEQISDGHVTTALPTVIVPRRSRKMPFEQAAPKKKGQCSLRGHGGARPTLPPFRLWKQRPSLRRLRHHRHHLLATAGENGKVICDDDDEHAVPNLLCDNCRC